MSDIFLSYAHEDQERARELAEALEERGWSVFWDRSIATGARWRRVVGKELAAARCVVVLWTEASLDSSWVAEESDEGRKREILAPVLLDPVEPPLGFRAIQAKDLSDWDGATDAAPFRELVADISKILALPPGQRQLDTEGAARRARRRALFWLNVGLGAVATGLALALHYWFVAPLLGLGSLLSHGVVAAIGGGILAYLIWLAGDDLKKALRRWMRRPGATVVLGLAAVALGALVGWMLSQRPAIVRLVPGVRIMGLMSTAEPPVPRQMHELRVWIGERDETPDWEIDLRKPGVYLGASEREIRVSAERDSQRIDDELKRYLATNPITRAKDAQAKDLHLGLWKTQPRIAPGPRLRGGETLIFELSREGEKVELDAGVLDLTVESRGKVTVCFLE